MQAVDTNILVRFLTQDDPAQAARATALIKREEIWIARPYCGRPAPQSLRIRATENLWLAFQKKTQATRREDIDLARRRYRNIGA